MEPRECIRTLYTNAACWTTLEARLTVYLHRPSWSNGAQRRLSVWLTKRPEWRVETSEFNGLTACACDVRSTKCAWAFRVGSGWRSVSIEDCRLNYRVSRHFADYNIADHYISEKIEILTERKYLGRPTLTVRVEANANYTSDGFLREATSYEFSIDKELGIVLQAIGKMGKIVVERSCVEQLHVNRPIPSSTFLPEP